MPKPTEKPKEQEEIQSSAASESASTQVEKTKKAEEKKAEEKKATDAELEEAKLDVVDRFFPGSKPKKKEEASPKEKPPEEKKEEAEAAPEKPKEKKEPAKSEKTPAKPKPAEPPPPVLDEVGKSLKDTPDEPKPVQKPEEPGLSDKEKRLLEACAHLEKTNKKYDGLVKAMTVFWDAEQKYISEWEAKNPGEQFKPDAEEHSKFYSENEPSVDPDDLEDAKVEVRAKRIFDQQSQVQNNEIRRDRIIQTVNQAKPRIDAEVFGAIASLIENSHEGLAKLLKKDEKTGVTYVDKEASDKMEEEDPLGKEILMEVAEPLSLVVREIELMRTLKDDYRGNRNNGVRLRRGNGWIFPAAEVGDLFARVEKQMREADPKETMRDGRRFVTFREMRAAIQQIDASNKPADVKRALREDLESRYYTLDYDDAIAAAIAEHSEQAKAKLTKVIKLRPKPASQEPPEKKEEETKKQPETKAKKAPSISAASDATDNGSVSAGKHTVDPKELDRKMGWA